MKSRSLTHVNVRMGYSSSKILIEKKNKKIVDLVDGISGTQKKGRVVRKLEIKVAHRDWGGRGGRTHL